MAPPEQSTRAVRGRVVEPNLKDLPSHSVVRKLFLNQLVYTFGGYGHRPSGGIHLWNSTVDLRKAYGYQPLVYKPEIEAFQGCNYYTGEAHSLALEAKKDIEWRALIVPQDPVSSKTTVHPAPRVGHSLTLLEDGPSLLVYGGHNLQEGKPPNIRGEVLLQDTLTLEWIYPVIDGKPPTPRTGHAACLIGRRLYIIGGYAGFGRFFKGVCVLDTASWTWQYS